MHDNCKKNLGCNNCKEIQRVKPDSYEIVTEQVSTIIQRNKEGMVFRELYDTFDSTKLSEIGQKVSQAAEVLKLTIKIDNQSSSVVAYGPDGQFVATTIHEPLLRNLQVIWDWICNVLKYNITDNH